EVDGDGAPLGAFDLARPVDDVALSGGEVAAISHSRLAQNAPCFGYSCSTPVTTYTYSLSFVWPYRLNAGLNVSANNIDTPAALSGNGSVFLVSWFEISPPRVKAAILGSSFHPFVLSTRAPT